MIKRCRICQIDKPGKAFQSIDKTVSPPIYKDVCIACEAPVKGAKLEVQLAKRKMERELEEEKKKLRKEFEAKDKARVQNRRSAKKHRDKARKIARKQHFEETGQPVGVTKPKIDAVTQELARRELAKKSLINFIKRFQPDYEAGWVHKLIAAKLEKFAQDVAEKKAPRLMIFMPPRTGKSQQASVMFPAWYLGHNPTHELISASYAVSLPIGFSRKIKDIIKSEDYKNIFPTRIDPNAQAAEFWKTTKGGAYVASGVGTGITGKGGHCMILDDPLKDAAEADSEVVRNSVWDWYSSTFRTRLAPGGGILVILTRWHDDDPAGRLLDQMRHDNKEIDEEIEEYEREQPEGWEDKVAALKEQYHEIEQWEILSFPALAEHDEFAYPDGTVVATPEEGTRLLRLKGEALHPERFDEVSLRKVKRTLQPRHWSALYQQNPVPEEGVYFTKSMMRYQPTMPDYRRMHVYSAWDLAIGTKQTNDWSVGLTGGLDYEGNLHILDMVRFKGNTDQIAANLMGQLKKYREQIQKFGLEQGQIQMAAWPTIERALRKEKIFIPWDNTLKPITDKMARARPAQGMMQQGRIILPQNQPWVDDFVAELLRFPGGKHDDVVDALAWLVRMVMKVEPPQKPKAQRTKSWKDQLGKYIEGRSSGGGAMGA